MNWHWALVLSALIASGSARASDITVLSTVATKAAFDILLPKYEQQSGNKIHTVYDSGAGVNKRVAAGEPFDVVVNATANVAALAKAGAVPPQPWARLGVAAASLVYRTGSAKPDISTDDAFKAQMLATPHLGISDPAAGGASAVYVIGILKRLGIYDVMQSRLVLTKPGEGPSPVADGRAPFAIAMTSEVAAYPGLSAMPIFPQEPAGLVSYSVTISAKTDDADAPQSLVQYLVSPGAVEVLKAKGFERD
jgi:molybdate transport system substrate-binding protein